MEQPNQHVCLLSLALSRCDSIIQNIRKWKVKHKQSSGSLDEILSSAFCVIEISHDGCFLSRHVQSDWNSVMASLINFVHCVMRVDRHTDRQIYRQIKRQSDKQSRQILFWKNTRKQPATSILLFFTFLFVTFKFTI